MLRLIPLLFAGVTLTTTACRSGSERLTDDDVAAIRDVGQQFTQAVVAQDYDRVLALHTGDVVWMAPDAPAAAGSEGLRQSLQSGPPAVSFVISPQHTEGSGSLAYDRGAFIWRGVVGSDTITSRGKYVQVLRRQADGTWRIALDIWNADEPQMPPAAAPASSPR